MKLVSVQEMLAIEKEADAAGLTYSRMMDHAGTGLAQALRNLPVAVGEKEILGLVGPGNNGGDTLVALRQLAEEGFRARAYLIKRKPDELVQRFAESGGQVLSAEADPDLMRLQSWMQTAAILLDGVLGTGTKPPLRSEVGKVIAAVGSLLEEQERPPYVVAVDCPSGVDCDTGDAPAEALAADLTVTMAAVKRGLLKLPAYDLVGDLRVVDIGLPSDLQSLQAVRTDVVDEAWASEVIPRRAADAHKGSFGTSLIVAGSVNYTGAAVLAGKAAYRVGAGLVTLAVPAPLHPALAGTFPEATWLLLPHELGVISRDAMEALGDGLSRATALLVGPGLGLDDTTRDFIERLLAEAGGGERTSSRIGFVRSDSVEPRKSPSNHSLPAPVVDADGLKLLAKIKDWHQKLSPMAILTPHPGEMSVLTGLPINEIQADREGMAVKFAREWGHVVVLKGAFTVIAAPDERRAVIPIASSALARAGTGDVLAGIVVGLRAQGIAPYEAATAGAWIHAEAGLHAARKVGATASVLAGDVLAAIPDVLSAL
jgi:hydroxyethylthiazole kinase-like uncharacterized protein yjeF